MTLPANTVVPHLGGTIEAGWDDVVRAFAAGLPHPERSGAALSVWHEGREVVNVWGGVRDARSGAPWTGDTLGVLFSVTKGLAAILLARLAESGVIDLQSPVAEIWPEFAQHGKGTISIADTLAHRAGVSAPIHALTLEQMLDSRVWARLVAEQAPLWAPGTGHAYHTLTYGPIVEELVRRATGRELSEVFAELVARPLKADVTLAPTPADLKRVAYLTTSPAAAIVKPAPDPDHEAWIDRSATLGGVLPRALVDGDSGFNDPRIQSAGLAGAGALGTASAVGRIWSATIRPTSGVRLLSERALEELRTPRSEGAWVFDPGPPYQRWGAGAQLSSEVTPWFSGASVGHDGAGGQSGVADPELGVALGYVRNRMDVVDAVAPIIASIKRLL